MLSGSLVVLSGPSGSGKDAFVDGIIDAAAVPVVRAKKITTRAPRPNERKESSYEHVDDSVFCKRIRSNLVPYYYVKNKQWYAVDTHFLFDQISSGKNVILVYSDYETVSSMCSDFEKHDIPVRRWLIEASQADLEARIRARKLGTDETKRRVAEVERELHQLKTLRKHYHEHFFNSNSPTGVRPEHITRALSLILHYYDLANNVVTADFGEPVQQRASL
jgi:Guanylate kinase